MTTLTVYAPGLTVEVFDKVVEPPPPPNPPGDASLVRVDIGNTGAANAFFRRPAMLPGGDILSMWKRNDGPSYQGNFLYSYTGKQWARTSAVGGWPYDLGQRENYDSTFDAVRNCVWLGCASVYSYAQDGGGTLKWDLATGVYSQAWPADLAAHAALFVHGDSLFTFGGWQVGPAQRLRERDIATGILTDINGDVLPPLTTEAARTSLRRSAKAADGRFYTLADGYALWTHPGMAGGQWAELATTGMPPASLYGNAALDPVRGEIVVYVGRDSPSLSGATVINRAFALSLATLRWSEIVLAGAVPVTQSQAGFSVLYDASNAVVVVVVENDVGTLVYELRRSL